MTSNFFVVEIYSDNTFSVSVMSEEEMQAVKDGMEEWQYDEASEVSEEEMINRAEDKGYEHDPW